GGSGDCARCLDLGIGCMKVTGRGLVCQACRRAKVRCSRNEISIRSGSPSRPAKKVWLEELRQGMGVDKLADAIHDLADAVADGQADLAEALGGIAKAMDRQSKALCAVLAEIAGHDKERRRAAGVVWDREGSVTGVTSESGNAERTGGTETETEEKEGNGEDTGEDSGPTGP